MTKVAGSLENIWPAVHRRTTLWALGSDVVVHKRAYEP
jgi:hypothetical protein